MKNVSTLISKTKCIWIFLLFAFPFVTSAQVLLDQSFNENNILSTYVGTGANQFDYINVSSPSSSNSVYVSNNRLGIQKYSGAGAVVKSTNLSATTPTTLRIKFSLNVPFNNFSTGTAAIFYVGSGLAAGPNTTGELANNGSRHSTLGIGFGTTGKFYLRNLNNFANTDSLTGSQEITWYINNSGASMDYTDPAGGSSSLIDDAGDVWIGTTRVFAAIPAVTPTVDLNNFKLLFPTAGTGQTNYGGISLDNISITTGTVALPVTFTSFTAQAQNTTNLLTWQTGSEVNNKGFYVQRKAANGTWANMAFVNANNAASTYTYTDASPLTNSYYRLQQVDVDGKITYSTVVSVTKNAIQGFSLAPNPTTDKVIVNLGRNVASNNIFATAYLYDFMGKKVLTQQARSGTFEINMAHLPKGSYILSVQSEQGVTNKKIIKN